ncbi:MAG: aminoacyl-tRNA hydrolase [Armatimonadota bacterium]
MAKTKLIIGLGNPGAEYRDTRHNIGFMVVDTIARRHHMQVKVRRNQAHIAEGTIEGQQVVLAKPMTFMNLSGQAVSGLMRRYRVDLSDVIIIYDDVALPLGKLRIRPAGSAGGHNGIKSIIHCIGSQDFPRVRIGIGSPGRDMVDHVLSKFHKVEREIVRDSVERAADAVEMILTSGLELAMNRFNTAAAAEQSP